MRSGTRRWFARNEVGGGIRTDGERVVNSLGHLINEDTGRTLYYRLMEPVRQKMAWILGDC